MTTENQRELAQLSRREEEEAKTETAAKWPPSAVEELEAHKKRAKIARDDDEEWAELFLVAIGALEKACEQAVTWRDERDQLEELVWWCPHCNDPIGPLNQPLPGQVACSLCKLKARKSEREKRLERECDEARSANAKAQSELEELRAWKAEALSFPPENDEASCNKAITMDASETVSYGAEIIVVHGIRPVVMEFARAMEETLRANDDKIDWAACHIMDLRAKLAEERREVNLEIAGRWVYDRLRAELLDEAVMCLILWARAGGSKTTNRGRDLPPPPAE